VKVGIIIEVLALVIIEVLVLVIILVLNPEHIQKNEYEFQLIPCLPFKASYHALYWLPLHCLLPDNYRRPSLSAG
jgi:hypothetical protein